jgi:hypothetical protein
MTERRPAVTASARGGAGYLRSGQKKACGAVEQKKAPKVESKSARKKVLAFEAAIRERKNHMPVGRLLMFPGGALLAAATVFG